VVSVKGEPSAKKTVGLRVVGNRAPVGRITVAGGNKSGVVGWRDGGGLSDSRDKKGAENGCRLVVGLTGGGRFAQRVWVLRESWKAEGGPPWWPLCSVALDEMEKRPRVVRSGGLGLVRRERWWRSAPAGGEGGRAEGAGSGLVVFRRKGEKKEEILLGLTAYSGGGLSGSWRWLAGVSVRKYWAPGGQEGGYFSDMAPGGAKVFDLNGDGGRMPIREGGLKRARH